MMLPIQGNCQQYQIISTSDGLPQSFISGIVQDNSGFLWIATKNGLARYDGVHYKLFQHNPSDTRSIKGDLIICLKYFDNAVWIEYKSGDIDKLNTTTEEITHYSLKSTFEKSGLNMLKRGWIIGSDHLLWAICEQNKIISYDFKNKKLRKEPFINNQGLFTFWGIQEDRKGAIWVITDKNIISYDKKKERYISYKLPISPVYKNDIVVGNTALDLHYKPNGDFLWGDTENLYTYSVRYHTIKMVKLPGKDKENVLWIESGQDGNEYFERGGKVWQYNSQKGLSLVNEILSKRSIAAKSFFMDKTGVLWIGTDARGILKVDMNNPVFYSFSPSETFPGTLLSEELGVSLSKSFGWTAADSEFSLPGYHIRSSYDVDGKLWIGIKTRVICYDQSVGKLTQFPEIKGLIDKDSRGIGIKGLTFDEYGSPIVAGYNGNLLVYDRKVSKWKWFLQPGSLRRLFGEDLVLSDIYADKERVWVTTETNGLLYINLKDRKIHEVKLSKEPLLGMLKDPQKAGLLWIGSYQGLICLNKKTLKTRVFTMEQGLPDNTVYALLDDMRGNLWFSTNKGLCRFNPNNYNIRVFQSQYGLPGNEFNRFHSLKLPDGRLSFGGPEGWVLFDPSKIRDNNFQPEVAFTGLKVNNIEVNHHIKKDILNKPINEMKELSLNYDQNTFMVSFAGMEFNQPQDLKFRYQLVGYDKEWVECGNITFANYTRLPAGNYEFRVNCSNTEGKWSEKIKTIKLSVEAPWWRKWWAYVIYALLFFTGLGYWLYLQRLRIKLEQSIAFKQKETEQLKQLTEMKSRFFTNMTHDFRTPLTLILSPLSELKEYLSGSPEEKKIDSIQKNSEELLSSINRLLDLSKLEENIPMTEESIGNVSEFVEGIVKQFQNEAFNNKIQLSFSSDISCLYRFNAEALKGILLNLIGNAVKFTLSGGSINVILKKGFPDGVSLVVQDTGIGIPDCDKPFIFNRYFQSRKNNDKLNVPGSGIGLFLVQEFVTSQKGMIKIESMESIGTTFTVNLPYGEISSPLSNITDTCLSWVLSEREADRTDENPVILLVEDNADMSEFIADVLPREYLIIRASNGEEGLKVAKEVIPDLIVTDLMMPMMDGLTLCKELRADEKTSHIPIIILTAREDINSKLDGLGCGAHDYLVKPFNIQDLTLRIHNNLELQIRHRKFLATQFDAPDNETEKTITDPFLQKLYDALEKDLSNSSLGIGELAQLLNISRVQLHRKIKAITGQTSVEIVRNYRLERSTEFLKAGYNSSEAAFRSGFDSPAYYSKCFKAYFKLTPSAYMKDQMQ